MESRDVFCVGGPEEFVDCHCHEQCYVYTARNYSSDMESFCSTLSAEQGHPCRVISASDTSMQLTVASENRALIM